MQKRIEFVILVLAFAIPAFFVGNVIWPAHPLQNAGGAAMLL